MSLFQLDVVDEEKRTYFEEFQPTGELEKDFKELSIILGIPLTISQRPKIPSSLPPESPKTPPASRRRESKLKAQIQDVRALEPKEPLPSTYIISEKNKFFKPQVLYETEIDNNKEHTKELYLRGWLADIRVLNILSKTLPSLEKLSVLDMWNAGLTDNTLYCLSQCLSSCHSLKTLNLDGNHLPTKQRFDTFLSTDGKLYLQNFSLRNCGINEKGASLLAEVLKSNSHLLTLNLSYNNIGDLGVTHIATSLRFNRTLLSLSIASNSIGDDGIKHIAKALSTFPLTHEQVVSRRKMLSLITHEELRSESTHKKTAGTTASQGGKKTKTKAKGKDSKREKANSDNAKNQKVKRGKGSESRDSPPPDDVVNPLCEKAKLINGELWIPGNRILINLNLSRNKITTVGLEMLQSVITVQGELSLENQHSPGSGLLRLNVQKNIFRDDHTTYTSLCELMKKRDPLHKHNIDNPFPEDEELT